MGQTWGSEYAAVEGEDFDPSGIGVHGECESGFGVMGTSEKGEAIVGASESGDGAAGVFSNIISSGSGRTARIQYAQAGNFLGMLCACPLD